MNTRRYHLQKQANSELLVILETELFLRQISLLDK